MEGRINKEALLRSLKLEASFSSEARKRYFKSAEDGASTSTDLAGYEAWTGPVVEDDWEPVFDNDYEAVIRPADIIKQLSESQGKFKVAINSFGGINHSASAIGTAMTDYINASKDNSIDMRIVQMAASAGAIIPMHASHVSMAHMADMMLHDTRPALLLGPTASDLMNAYNRVNGISDSIAKLIADARGLKSWKTVREWMSARSGEGTWFTAHEALEGGLVDEIIPVEETAGAEESEAPEQESFASVIERESQEIFDRTQKHLSDLLERYPFLS